MRTTEDMIEEFLRMTEDHRIEMIRKSWEARCPDWEIVRIYRAFEGDFRIIVRRSIEEDQRWSVGFQRLADGQVHCSFSRK